MSRAKAANLFGALRAINGALESAVAHVRSSVSHLRGARSAQSALGVSIDAPSDEDTIVDSLDTTAILPVRVAAPAGATGAATGAQGPRLPHLRRTTPTRTPARRSRSGVPGMPNVRTVPQAPVAPREAAEPIGTGGEREQVERQRLSPTFQRWIAAYSSYGPRDLYLWKWCALGVNLTALPCVDAAFADHLADTKLLSIMVNVLLDDIADQREPGELLTVLMAIPRGATPDVTRLSESDRRYVAFTAEVWNEYWRRAREYPCFAAYERLLAYDLDQLFNAIQYSALLNQQLGLLNVVEHDLYSPHNMMMMSFATLDLMASPGFQLAELGRLREAVWHAQWMGRIGNLLSTWQREAAVGDFTSGVFARAVSLGELTVDQLRSAGQQEIESSINQVEHHEYYRRRWAYHRKCFQARAAEIRSLDLGTLLAGHDRFFGMHLGSRGLI